MEEDEKERSKKEIEIYLGDTEEKGTIGVAAQRGRTKQRQPAFTTRPPRAPLADPLTNILKREGNNCY